MFRLKKILSKSRQPADRDEAVLIKLAKEDSRRFGELYEMYFDRIFIFVFKRVGGNEEVSGDLTQLCFMKAMANIRKYEDRGLPFSAWLYRIAQNEVNMFFRSQKKQWFVEIDERKVGHILEETTGESGFSQQELDQLVAILNKLEESQADMLELRFFQEMSFKEIADIYSITEANAKMRVYRLLEKIKQQWKRES